MRHLTCYGILLLLFSLVALGCQEGPGAASAEADWPAEQTAAAQERLMASDGGQLVLEAIEAHGGLAAWYNAPTSSYAWEYSNEGSNIRFKSVLVADNRTRHVYHDLVELGTPDNPQPIEGRFAWDGKDAWISPDTLQGPNPRFWATTGYYFESIPFILADPGLQYERLPDEMLDGQTYQLVKVGYDDGVGDSPGDTYTLYVHPETKQVFAIRYTVTYGRGRPAPDQTVRQTLFYYEDYVTVDGLTVAQRFRGFNWEDGGVTTFKNEAWASDISFTQPFDASRLEMPENGRVQPLPGE